MEERAWSCLHATLQKQVVHSWGWSADCGAKSESRGWTPEPSQGPRLTGPSSQVMRAKQTCLLQSLGLRGFPLQQLSPLLCDSVAGVGGTMLRSRDKEDSEVNYTRSVPEEPAAWERGESSPASWAAAEL